LSFLGRLGRLRSGEAGLRRPGADMAKAPPPPAPPLTDAEKAVLAEAAKLGAQYNWMRTTLAQGRLAAGLQLSGGEVLVWAVDRQQPLRPLPVALMIDGSVVAEAFTAPGDGALLVPSGWYLLDHTTLELVIDGERAAGPGFTDHRFWSAAAARAEAAEFLDRLKRSWRSQKARRTVRTDIDGTLERLARPEPAVEGQPAPFLRYLARATHTPIRAAGALALANWIIGDVMEDPLRRELFCLDDATAAVLNEPAFNPQVLRVEVSLALLCFWRRHYQSLDLFSDDGLRRLHFKLATAPFIRLKNNQQMISAPARARLSAPAAGTGRATLPWSWFWAYLHQDQGTADRLDDPAYQLALSFREVAADALDPGRLSFNPASWQAWWSGWACGDEPGFSRFDLALISLLEPGSSPAALVAEQGPELWAGRLHDAYYGAMPGLAALSLVCPPPPVPEDDLPRCDLAVIGYFNGSGLARNMAMFVDALAPCHPLVFDARSGRCIGADEPADAALVRARVVLLCVNADRVPEVIARFASLCAEAHVIAFCLWETDHPPETHRFGALAVDEIWTPSHYVAEAYRQITHVPVSVVGKGLRPPQPARWQRLSRRFQRDGAFTFLQIADFSSSVVRKNPLDTVRAFRAAFDADNANVRLVIKLREIDRGHWSNIDGYWDEVEALAAGDPRIEFLVGDLSEDEYWALVGACDALVSLHRGEGFCYPVADALLLGRPVVVTDYSGTRDYCTEETAFLVEPDIVPAPPSHLRCTTPIGNWSQPRLDSAVAAMRRVVARRAEAAARAAAGQALLARQYDFIGWRAGLLARLTPYFEGRGAAPGALILSSLAPAWSAAPGHAD